MPAATADALRLRLLETFPPDRPYRRADLAAEPMPPIVAHYLEHLLDERLRHHAHAALRGPFDADSAAVRAVRERFLRALYTAAQFHAEEWESALSEAADRSVTFLLRPARVLAAAVFERQRGPLSLPAALARMERFAGHDYFVEGVAHYAADPGTDPEIDDIGFAKLLVQIDTYVAERRSARGWVESARPFFALGRLFPEDPGLAARLLVSFFEPRLPVVAARLQEERYGLDAARLFALLTEAGVPPDPLDDEPFADEPESPARPASERLGFELIEDFEPDDDLDHVAELPPLTSLPDEPPLPYPAEATHPAVPETAERAPEAATGLAQPQPPGGGSTLSLVSPAEDAPEEAPEETPAPAAENEQPAETDKLAAATPDDAKAALAGDAVPLWKRFAREPRAEPVPAAAPPSAPEPAPKPAPKPAPEADAPPPAPPVHGDVWPPHARPADPAQREQKAVAPLWKQFVRPKNEPPADAPVGTRHPVSTTPSAASAAPSAASAAPPAVPAASPAASPPVAARPDGALASPSPLAAAAAALSSRPAPAAPAPAAPAPAASSASLDDLERGVLGPRAPEKRAWFVRELFGGDPEAYAAVLRHLSGVTSWDEAWKVIGAEVFRKHRVNIYGPAAVAFTDAVEARHKQRAAG